MTGAFGSAAALETHISQLFFTADRVYKLLKPVKTPFLDFEDRAARLAAASAEYELNHRISPQVYLGTTDVIERGELADRMIVMRRLAGDRQMDRLVAEADFIDRVKEVARFVASFHSRQDPVRGDDAWMARRDAVQKNWEDNLAQIEPVIGSILYPEHFAEVQELAGAYLAGREPLFTERIAKGWVRDGHGDLRCEHVFCLPDGPQIIDCLAFRDEYRIGDVLADIGFLAMDLHRLAGAAAAMILIAEYDHFANEHHPSSLAHHYVAYRAHVRAKIACIRFGQGDSGAAGEIQTYHQLALQHLRHGRVRLVLVGGGAGVGKSTVAAGLAQQMGAAVLRTDEVRKDLAGLGHDQHAFAEPGADLYRPEFSERVYAEVLREAEMLLARGESVIIDASWSQESRREAARALARHTDSTLVELCCVLDPALAKERIARRMSSVHNPSDATPEVADHLASTFEAWPCATPIGTHRPPDHAIEDAYAAVFANAHAVRRSRPARAQPLDLSMLAETSLCPDA